MDAIDPHTCCNPWPPPCTRTSENCKSWGQGTYLHLPGVSTILPCTRDSGDRVQYNPASVSVTCFAGAFFRTMDTMYEPASS